MSTEKLPEPFIHAKVVYPYEWPGIKDGIKIVTRPGQGIVYSRELAVELAKAILRAVES